MEIELIPVDPAQNYTLFVATPVETALRPSVAAALMQRQDPPAEQVAFLCSGGPLPRMEMMGGEFCGNASRSFGMLTAMEQNLRRGSVTVEVSGCSHPLQVEVDLDRGTARVEMPLPQKTCLLETAGHRFSVLVFEGLCHAVVEADPDPVLARTVLEELERSFSPDAAGVIFLQRQPLAITPVVYVPATGSTVWENSCGSGSLAAALWLAAQQPHRELQEYAIAQPGGLLEVSLRLHRGQVISARLGGPVTVGSLRRVTLSL